MTLLTKDPIYFAGEGWSTTPCPGCGRAPEPGDQRATLPKDWKPGLRQLLTCEAVVLLPGWQTSEGARLEASVARKLGMTLELWLDTS